jgi:hypothetical protein
VIEEISSDPEPSHITHASMSDQREQELEARMELRTGPKMELEPRMEPKMELEPEEGFC